MQLLLSRMRAAVEKYNMISAGDNIAVGVSSGKDSLVLLYALAKMRSFYPVPYELAAVTVDMNFFNENGDFSQITALCSDFGIRHIVRKTGLYHIVFETRREKNPCSLCANIRRGILHDMAKNLGCNKLALGHHLDDAAETFMLNLLSRSRIGCFKPVTYLSRKDLYVIRPLIFATEKEISFAAKKTGLPVSESCCPAGKTGERRQVKDMLSELEAFYPRIKEKIEAAMQKNGVDGW